MYVNKRLDGIQAIQTLSRLNRTAKGKEDTFVLDFVNDADDIQQAFQPYFEDTTIGEDADVHQFYQLQHDLAEPQVFFAQEVDQLCEVFFRARRALTKADNGLLYSIVDKAVPRFEVPGGSAAGGVSRKVGAVSAFVRLPEPGDPVSGYGSGEAFHLPPLSGGCVCPRAASQFTTSATTFSSSIIACRRSAKAVSLSTMEGGVSQGAVASEPVASSRQKSCSPPSLIWSMTVLAPVSPRATN